MRAEDVTYVTPLPSFLPLKIQHVNKKLARNLLLRSEGERESGRRQCSVYPIPGSVLTADTQSRSRAGETYAIRCTLGKAVIFSSIASIVVFNPERRWILMWNELKVPFTRVRFALDKTVGLYKIVATFYRRSSLFGHSCSAAMTELCGDRLKSGPEW